MDFSDTIPLVFLVCGTHSQSAAQEAPQREKEPLPRAAFFIHRKKLLMPSPVQGAVAVGRATQGGQPDITLTEREGGLEITRFYG